MVKLMVFLSCYFLDIFLITFAGSKDLSRFHDMYVHNWFDNQHNKLGIFLSEKYKGYYVVIKFI